MPSQYDPQLAILLAGLCEQTYIQYGNGPRRQQRQDHGSPGLHPGRLLHRSRDRAVDRSLRPLHPLSSVDWAHTLECGASRALCRIPRRLFRVRAHLGELQHHRAARHAHPVRVGHRRLAAAGSRATRLVSPPEIRAGACHLGFLVLFALLADQILEAAKGFNPSLPCLVTGHSLGAALAVLASPTVDLLTANNDVRMYNFAGPRVGNPAFMGPTASSSRRATASST